MSRDEATLTFLTPEQCAAATRKLNADNEVTVALGDAPSQASRWRRAMTSRSISTRASSMSHPRSTRRIDNPAVLR